jgi:hypothetical protein
LSPTETAPVNPRADDLIEGKVFRDHDFRGADISENTLEVVPHSGFDELALPHLE